MKMFDKVSVNMCPNFTVFGEVQPPGPYRLTKMYTCFPYLNECTLQIKIIEDFDRLITIKIHGYPSVEDYYRDASNADRVAHVRTPLIAVNTMDDPFVPAAG